ncbi:MAG: DNA alkylation repair protein [Blastocatellia bacterium]
MARQYQDIAIAEAESLLHSPIHDERLVALLILVRMYTRGKEDIKRQVYECYLRNTAWINNWDLVDGTAYFIAGPHLATRDRKPLYKLAKSKSLWERRIAIVATMHFVRQGEIEDTFRIAEILLHDKEDLMHKAVGWLLREAGKRDLPALETFLARHAPVMPRTMLRYAIEKLPEARRQKILKGKA